MESNIHKLTIKNQPNTSLTKRPIVILILIITITLLVVIIDSISIISMTLKSISTTPKRNSTSHWRKTRLITVYKSPKSYPTNIIPAIIHKPHHKDKSKDT